MVQIYLAAIEGHPEVWGFYNKFLVSFMYAKRLPKHFWRTADTWDSLMVDSGAHSFFTRSGIGVSSMAYRTDLPDPIDYCHEYCKWIKGHRPSIDTFIELDIDKVVGWEKQLELRAVFKEYDLEPLYVWHPTNKMTWAEMCKKYPYVGLGSSNQGFDFVRQGLKVAERYGTKVHLFAYTKWRLLPHLRCFKSFYSTDSSSWLVGSAFGHCYFWDGDHFHLYRGNRLHFEKAYGKDFRHGWSPSRRNIWNVIQWRKWARTLE